MGVTANFELFGPGIEVRYVRGDDKLTARGYGGRLGSDETAFTGEQITKTATEDGDLWTVVLLESSRGGVQSRLSLLLPQVNALTEEQELTAVGILVADSTHIVGQDRPVRQEYDVRPLTGRIWA